MKTKQTALDYLIQEIIPSSVLPIKYINEIISKAKAMEKEQIEKAYDNGGDYYTETGKAIWGKDYYNETYNKQDNEL